jgi:hypothetical protein
MTQEHINIESVIACLESDLEYYTLKFDYAVGTQDRYYYMGLKKGIENALSTIKTQMP